MTSREMQISRLLVSLTSERVKTFEICFDWATWSNEHLTQSCWPEERRLMFNQQDTVRAN